MKARFIAVGMCLLFVLCGYLVNFRLVNEEKTKDIKLMQSIGHVANWQLVKNNPMLDIVVDELQLDDYINQTYTNGKELVTVYVGYYYSAKKVGASHDPMVCFPGQGWHVDKNTKGMVVQSENIRQPFEYASMVAELGENTELLVYWFQAYDEPTSTTFRQKIKLAGKKIAGKGEDNAFVRFSTRCDSKDFESCRQVVLSFVDSFYPPFLQFVTAGN